MTQAELIEKLTEALEYYANEEHYEPVEGFQNRAPGVLTDRGRKAREALEWKK